MPENNQATVFYCPNCGSSVAMEGERGTCAYCGTAIERPRDARPASTPDWPPTLHATPRAVRADMSPARRGMRSAGVLVLVLLAALAGFAAGRLLPSGQVMPQPGGLAAVPTATMAPPSVRLDAGSLSELAAVLPVDGPGGDLVAYLYHSGENNQSFYTLARIDGASRQTRWQSAPLGKNAYQGLLAVAPDMLYVTDEDTLLALRPKDGTTAWQATLEVEPQTACDECLRVVGERVLVLEKNGGLQAFDTSSGQLAWSTRLPDTPRRLPIVGGDRLLTIRNTPTNNGRVLTLLDAATGKPTVEIDPRCPSAHEGFDEERPQSDSPFLFSEDGRSMVAIYGFFAKCAQGWDLAAGQPTWQIAIDDRMAPASWSSGGLLQTDDALYIGNGGLLWALATADGATRTLADDKEYNVTPLAARDGMLLALAAPTWDSQRKILWGLDTQTGELHWQLKLDAHEWIGQSSSGDFDFRLTAQGLTVLQVLRDDAKLVVETLNPRTGASQSRQESALDGMSMPSLRSSHWGDDTAWLAIDGDVLAIDLASGKIAYRLE
jgi:outer membrane protein assembly factor BamB